MAAMARSFGANIIKNTGDSLIYYYFPETVDSPNNAVPYLSSNVPFPMLEFDEVFHFHADGILQLLSLT